MFTFVTTDPRLLEIDCTIKSPVKLTTGQIVPFLRYCHGSFPCPRAIYLGQWHVRGEELKQTAMYRV